MTPQEAAEFRNALRAYGPTALLTLALWAEARGEPIEAQVGVGCVIRTRVHDRRWPDTYQEVILQPLQFSAFNVEDVNFAKIFELAGLDSDEARRKEPVLPQLEWVARGIVEDKLRDSVGSGNHYYDLSVLGAGDRERAARFVRAVDMVLKPTWYQPAEVEQATELVHAITASRPPAWDDFKTPTARHGRLIFYRL